MTDGCVPSRFTPQAHHTATTLPIPEEDTGDRRLRTLAFHDRIAATGLYALAMALRLRPLVGPSRRYGCVHYPTMRLARCLCLGLFRPVPRPLQPSQGRRRRKLPRGVDWEVSAAAICLHLQPGAQRVMQQPRRHREARDAPRRRGKGYRVLSDNQNEQW